MSPRRSKRIRSELAAASAGQFEIVREIGRGGMGWVFLARDLRLNRRVALKVLSPRLLLEDGMGERFLREAQILASLRHASIVGVHSVHQAGDLHFFAMDFIDGPPLDHVLKQRGQLSIQAARSITYMVGNALDYGPFLADFVRDLFHLGFRHWDIRFVFQIFCFMGIAAAGHTAHHAGEDRRRPRGCECDFF